MWVCSTWLPLLAGTKGVAPLGDLSQLVSPETVHSCVVFCLNGTHHFVKHSYSLTSQNRFKAICESENVEVYTYLQSLSSLLLPVCWLVPCIVPSTLTAPAAPSAPFKRGVEAGWSYDIPVPLSWGRVSEWFAEVRCPPLMESLESWAQGHLTGCLLSST